MKVFSCVAALFLCVASASPGWAEQRPPAGLGAESFFLDNGLQVVVIPQRRAPVVTHTLWYKVGGADNEPGQSGLAHFFEHLMFKGTENNSKEVFQDAVKSVGGYDNAFTGNDFTAYVQQVTPEALPEMMRLEADRMRNLVLSDEDIETERQVVIEERVLTEENEPGSILQEAIRTMLFTVHPYRTPIGGWHQDLESVDREQLMAFYDRYYQPNNAVLVVAGDVDADVVRRLAEEAYGQVERGPEVPLRFRPEEPEPKVERRAILRDERVTLPTFSRSWIAPATFSPEGRTADALMVLVEILGGGERSRLHQELVVRRQIASSVSASISLDSRDYSVVSVRARPIELDKLEEVQRAVDAEVEKIAREGVSDQELETVKKVLASGLVLGWESQMSRAMGAGIHPDGRQRGRPGCPAGPDRCRPGGRHQGGGAPLSGDRP
jgi:zinc protease